MFIRSKKKKKRKETLQLAALSTIIQMKHYITTEEGKKTISFVSNTHLPSSSLLLRGSPWVHISSISTQISGLLRD